MDHDQDPRWIGLRPSRIQLAVTVGGALAASLVIVFLPLPWWTRLALLAAIVVVGMREIRRACLLGPKAVTAFYLLDGESAQDGAGDIAAAGVAAALAIRLRHGSGSGDRQGAEAEGIVQSGAYVTPWFTSLPYRLANEPRWRKWLPRIITLWPDSLDANAFRRVRVQLKWK